MAHLGRAMAPAPTIQNSSVTQKLIAALGIRGKHAAPTMGDMVHPVAIVEDITRATWWTRGAAVRPAGGFRALTPAAGNIGVISLVNPANSGTVILVELLSLSGVAAISALDWTITGAAGLVSVGPSAVNFRDSALGTIPVGFIATSEYAGPLIVATSLGCAVVSTSINHNQIIDTVLQPGTALSVQGETVAVGIRVGFRWLERYIGS